MRVSDYIVEFLISKGITDVFGYPGGMVTYLMNSFDKYKEEISAHVNYNEQGAAFAACGFAQITHKPGVAYATSGPGATNLITGIANAYFDSIPTIFITGQVNTFEAKGKLLVRQRGFQETDIVAIVKPITLYAVQITNAKDIRFELEKAYYISMEGRRGPVLLDIPMNIQREEIEVDKLRCYQVQGNDRGSATEGCYNRDTLLEDCCNREAVSDDCCNREAVSDDRYDRNVTEDCNNREAMTDNRYDIIIQELEKAERPCMLVGAGIKNSGLVYEFRRLAMSLGIPVVSSMIAADIMKKDSSSYYGFIGAYGHRSANFIVAKCDLLISIGSRLDCRQTGVNKEIFAPNAKLVRIDIDENELTNRIKENEIQIVDQLTSEKLNSLILKIDTNLKKDYSSWKSVCAVIDSSLKNYDNNKIQDIMKKMCSYIPDNVVITTDVGQNQVWISQGFEFKENQMALYTGGHGAMGYSLPAAIGAYYASKKSVYCFTGDGGIQMNIQELEFVKREKLPIKIIIMNNYSLGMIRHFQEIYFDANYYQTGKNNGYSVPDFEKIAYAYDISYVRIKEIDQISGDLFINPAPTITEFVLDYDTYVFPKLSMGRPCQDQDPLIDRELYDYLMKI